MNSEDKRMEPENAHNEMDEARVRTGTARQTPPPVRIMASPLEKRTAVYAPLPLATAGSADGPFAQLNLDLFINNTGPANLQLSGLPSNLIRPTIVEI